MSIQEAAAIGSPTAKKLLAQMELEAKQLHDEAMARQIEQQREASAARIGHIQNLRNQATEALALYEDAKSQVEAAVVALHRLDRQLPHDVSNRIFPAQFRKINLPRAVLSPLDELHPTFSTMENKLQAAERF